MSNSNFDKNGVDSSGVHWLQYVAFVVTAFAIYFGCFLKMLTSITFYKNIQVLGLQLP